MILNLNEPKNNIVIGNADDVCILCAKELSDEKKISLTMADKKLHGTFEGKKMLRIPLNGFRATICMDHIHKISEANKDC